MELRSSYLQGQHLTKEAIFPILFSILNLTDMYACSSYWKANSSSIYSFSIL